MANFTTFTEVPVVNVTSNNIKDIWPSLVLALKTSTFVAIDSELSGLGNRKLLGARALPDRYKNLCEVAKTRSVLSLGLSCFKLQSVGPAARSQADGQAEVQISEWKFSVQTFNVMLLCSEDYMVEPSALRFLVEHGFDFNKQYSSGVRYHRGKEKIGEDAAAYAKSVGGPTARQLFEILVWSQVPVVLHNGFLDLVFLYQNFYTDLPATLQVFLADLADMFPCGILDTKYAVEFVDRLPATYLEYAFRKWQRRNALQACFERRQVCLDFSPCRPLGPHVTHSQCSLPAACVEMDFIPKASALQDLVCQSFAGHGWCGKGKQCSKSHAIDLILDLDGIKAAKGRKRRRKLKEMQLKVNSGNNQDEEPPASRRQRLNSSGDTADPQIKTDSQNESVENGENGGLDSSGDTSSVTDDVNGANAELEDGDFDAVTDQYLRTSLQMEASRSGGHRAGFDAFMTGFVMACILSKHTSLKEGHKPVVGAGIKLASLSGAEHFTNKLYAMGKDQPMIVAKSNFCGTSKNHRERIQKFRKA